MFLLERLSMRESGAQKGHDHQQIASENSWTPIRILTKRRTSPRQCEAGQARSAD
jgi:hypothetical protein